MNNLAARSANRVLGLFGARLVRVRPPVETFSMQAALARAAAHGFPVACVLDIGASDGSWSDRAMEFFPNASFLAIEPLAERQPALQALKERRSRFDYAVCVAGEADAGTASLTLSPDLDGSTIDGAGENRRAVPIRSLDGLVKEKSLKGPFFLKFDTHGFEIPILAGATETLRDTNLICMEVYNFDITRHAARFPQMCLALERLGFRCYDLAEPLLRRHDGAFWQADLFFARSDATLFSHPHYS